jgi:heat shock protein HslJ
MHQRIVLLALPLLAACATAGASAVKIEGSTWSFVAIDGKAPVSSKARLTIGTDRIGANVGCNGLGGDLKVEHDRLVVGPVISTEMFCDGVMDQERAVGALLGASPHFEIRDGTLHLEGGGHSADLTRQN